MGIASKLQSGPTGASQTTPGGSQSFPQSSAYPQQQGYGAANPYGQAGQQYGQSQGAYPSIGPANPYPSIGPASAYPSTGPSTQPSGFRPEAGMQGYGAQQAPVGFSLDEIRQKLGKMIFENRLQHFYPPQRVEELSQQVSRLDVVGLGRRWNLPREVNLDLITLALYDIVIWADDSTSMQALDHGERIQDLKAILGRVADAATLFDTDGIDLRFFNSPKEFNNLRSAADVTAAIQQVKFEGYTPLGSGLEQKCIIPFVITPARNNFMKKPVLIITITDGEPTGPGERRQTTRDVIVRARQYLTTLPYGTGAAAFMFAQVGKDQNATEFLNELDVDPQVGKMIDCVGDYEIEEMEYKRKNIQLTPDVYLVKLMVGAIDQSYDEADEG